MQQKIIFTTEPNINWRGYNQKVPILAIQEKTFQHYIFESMTECVKKLNVDLREVSRISLGKLYTCAKGWTFIRINEKTSIPDETAFFMSKRKALDISYNIPDTRICYGCKIKKPLTKEYFHKSKPNSKYSKLLFKSLCKECRKGEHFESYRKDKEREMSDSLYRATSLLNTYKRLDKKKGVVCNLTAEWIEKNIVGKPCIYCSDEGVVGIDRVDNGVGHTTNNSIPCCKICNATRMHHFTHQEFKEIGLVIKKIKEKRNGYNP